MKLKYIIFLIIGFISINYLINTKQASSSEEEELRLAKKIDADIKILAQDAKEKSIEFTNKIKARFKELESQHPHFTSLFAHKIIKSGEHQLSPEAIKALNNYCKKPEVSCSEKEKAFYSSLNK